MRRGLDGLESFTIEDDGVRRLEACQSPVWDTALAVVALPTPALPATIRRSSAPRDWLLDQQILARGDWAIKRPRLDPGGWAFEFANANYPDVDDTRRGRARAAARRAPRRRARARGDRARGAVGRGDAERRRRLGRVRRRQLPRLLRDLPFCDFGEVIDPPSADVTAHAIEMLAALGRGATRRRAGARLAAAPSRSPTARGSAAGASTTSTARAPRCPRWSRRAFRPTDERIRRAVRWLEDHQNADGGWGEDCRSYDDPAWIGRGASTASQTAWALLALDAAGERSRGGRRGVRWLVATQRPDGSWDEPQFTGTGFPSRLLHQLPPLPAGVPDHGAGAGARGEPATATVLTAMPSREAVMAQAARGELPGRAVAARSAHAAGTCWRSTASPGSSTTSATRSRATGWRCSTSSSASSTPRVHPVMRALARTVRECALPREPFLRLIEANRHDQVVTQLRHVRRAARLLPAVGRAGRRAGPARVRRRDAGADRALGQDLRRRSR